MAMGQLDIFVHMCLMFWSISSLECLVDAVEVGAARFLVCAQNLWRMWHVHLLILQVNEKLEARLQKYKVAAGGNDMVERVLHLETELAEAMEANNMYKLQLRRYVWPAPFLAHHTWKVHCCISHLVAVFLSSRDVVVLEDSKLLQETPMGQSFFNLLGSFG